MDLLGITPIEWLEKIIIYSIWIIIWSPMLLGSKAELNIPIFIGFFLFVITTQITRRLLKL